MESKSKAKAPTTPSIYLIEDDAALADSLQTLLDYLGNRCVVFNSGEDFMKAFIESNEHQTGEGCIICDIRLPGMSGLEVFSKLKKDFPKSAWEIILITGHGDVNMAVEAMQSGAYDFITKPFDPYLLIEKITNAVSQSNTNKSERDYCLKYEARQKTLSKQEELVMSMILQLIPNREIAEKLDISTRTVEVHRAHVFKKMEVNSAAELSQLQERYKLWNKD